MPKENTEAPPDRAENPEETEPPPDRAETAAFVVCPFACCTCCVAVVLLGTAITFARILCADGERSSCSLLVLSPARGDEKGITEGGTFYHTYQMIEESSETWGFDFGGVDAGSVSAGGSYSAGTSTGSQSSSGMQSSGGSQVKRAELKVYTGQPLEKIENHWAKFMTVAAGYVFCKLIKLAGIVAKFYPKEFPYPVHLTTIFLSESQIASYADHHRIVGALVKMITFLFDYILLSWAPNMATIPFTSIAGEDEYINTVQIKYDTDMFWYVAVAMGGAMISYFVVFVLDGKFSEKNVKGVPEFWPTWNKSQKHIKLLRVVAGVCRAYLLAVSVAALGVAYFLSRAEFSLFFGLNFALLFKWSFRFGLMVWATCLRVVLTLFTFVDFLVSALAFFAAEAVKEQIENMSDRVSVRMSQRESPSDPTESDKEAPPDPTESDKKAPPDPTESDKEAPPDPTESDKKASLDEEAPPDSPQTE